MNILSHHDSTVIGTFETSKIAYYVDIELPESEKYTVVLSAVISQPRYSIDDKLIIPIIVDTDLLLFFVELSKKMELFLSLPVKIDTAMIMIVNFKAQSMPSYYYLVVSSKGQSEKIQFYPKKMTLRRNYFPIQE